MIAPVDVVGDGVAAQCECDYDAVLTGGGVGCHASAVEGAVGPRFFCWSTACWYVRAGSAGVWWVGDGLELAEDGDR